MKREIYVNYYLFQTFQNCNKISPQNFFTAALLTVYVLKNNQKTSLDL